MKFIVTFYNRIFQIWFIYFYAKLIETFRVDSDNLKLAKIMQLQNLQTF